MLSIVVPVFNEEEGLGVFFERLTTQLGKVKVKYEIIFVDDGSTDNSLEILKEFTKKNNTVKVLSFRKNHGKAEALTLGFHIASGETIVTMDADLQDRPEEIPNLLEKLNNHYDVVSGWRKNRKDSWKMVFASKIFNKIVKMLWGIDMHDYNCGLKAYTREAAKSLHLYGGMHRFIPLLCVENGFAVGEVVVEHDKRKFGKSKFGFSKTWKDVPDMFTIIFLTHYGKRPLHFFGLIGSILMFIGLILLGYFSVIHTLFRAQVGDRPLLFISLLLVIAGLQVAITGFLADLIINISYNKDQNENWKPFIKFTNVSV